MRFKSQRSQSQLPEVNLIPMLNVMMGILAFFVMITMSLTSSRSVDLQLPNNAQAAPPSDPQEQPDPLIVAMAADGQLMIREQAIAPETVELHMQAYLNDSPNGMIYLLPDRQLPYEQVVQFLGTMKGLGGDRVSLAVEPGPRNP